MKTSTTFRTVKSTCTILVSLGVAFAGGGTVRARTVEEFVTQKLIARVYSNAHGALPYRLFIPANYTPASSYPAVLFLHGKGGCGTDNLRQLTDAAAAPLLFLSKENQKKNPSFLVAPQCPGKGSWAVATRRVQVYELMKALQKEFNIDGERLYITGLSLGGYGTWSQLAHYPKMYAAAVPICGYGASSLAPTKIVHIPIWNFHGANDDIVTVRNSRNIIAALRKAGGNPIYTEYATGGHFVWTAAYTTPLLMEWLYSQKRGAASPKPPLLTITEPIGQSTYASASAAMNLSGTAADGRAGPASVTWANYQNGQLAAGGGRAAGRTSWAITNVSLSAGCTNLIVVTATTTSYNAGFGGHTTFNDTLRVRPGANP